MIFDVKMRVLIRPASEKDDCEKVWKFRNSKEIREISMNKEEIPFDSHKSFWEKHKDEYKIIIVGGKWGGYVRLDENNFVSIALLPIYRDIGIGSKILSDLKDGTKAIIKYDNILSQKAFMKAGFKHFGDMLIKRKGWSR